MSYALSGNESDTTTSSSSAPNYGTSDTWNDSNSELITGSGQYGTSLQTAMGTYSWQDTPGGILTYGVGTNSTGTQTSATLPTGAVPISPDATTVPPTGAGQSYGVLPVSTNLDSSLVTMTGAWMSAAVQYSGEVTNNAVSLAWGTAPPGGDGAVGGPVGSGVSYALYVPGQTPVTVTLMPYNPAAGSPTVQLLSANEGTPPTLAPPQNDRQREEMEKQKSRIAGQLAFLDSAIPNLEKRIANREKQGIDVSADKVSLGQYNTEWTNLKSQYDALSVALGTLTWDQMAARLRQRRAQRPDPGDVARGRIDRWKESRGAPGGTQRYLEGLAAGVAERLVEAGSDPLGYLSGLGQGIANGLGQLLKHPLQTLHGSILEGLTDTPRQAGNKAGKGLVDSAAVKLITAGVNPGAPTPKPVKGILDQLPGKKGKTGPIKLVPNEQALSDLFNELTQEGKLIDPGSYPGRVMQLPDGTIVRMRPGSKSGGATLDTTLPNGTIYKVHIQ